MPQPASKDPPVVLQTAAANARRCKVMISYCWAEKALACRLHSALENHGHTVWRDDEELRGQFTDGIAQAIQKCDMFICIASSGYKGSFNCKMELHYAHRRVKKLVPLLYNPNHNNLVLWDWLGLLLSPYLYYDVSHHALEAEAFIRLIAREL